MGEDPRAGWRALAQEGPAFATLQSLGAIDWAEWERAAVALEARIDPGPTRDRRIHHLYVPSLLWIERQVAQNERRPRVVGLCAPQGSGKTTLVRELVPLLEARGLRSVAVSIDDFYLRRQEQVALAEAHPGNRYLEHRGAPGSHDVRLGEEVLERLERLGPGETTALPLYDKSAHGGRGDRAPESQWPTVSGPLDVVLIEGWCLGFCPLPDEEVPDEKLRVVNGLLAAYDGWQRRIEALMHWRARSLVSIVTWRVEAEQRSRAAGRPALDRAAAEDYIRRFLPVYAAYEDTVATAPWRDRMLSFVLGADRLPKVA